MANELSKIVDEVLKDIPTPEELTTELQKVGGGAYSKPKEKRASRATGGVSAAALSQGFEGGEKKSGDSIIPGVEKQKASQAGTPSVPKAPKPTISTATKEQPITAI